MTKNQTTNKYSEDFKKSLVMLHQNGKSITIFAENITYQILPLVDGLNFIVKLKLKMAKF